MCTGCGKGNTHIISPSMNRRAKDQAQVPEDFRGPNFINRTKAHVEQLSFYAQDSINARHANATQARTLSPAAHDIGPLLSGAPGMGAMPSSGKIQPTRTASPATAMLVGTTIWRDSSRSVGASNINRIRNVESRCANLVMEYQPEGVGRGSSSRLFAICARDVTISDASMRVITARSRLTSGRTDTTKCGPRRTTELAMGASPPRLSAKENGPPDLKGIRVGTAGKRTWGPVVEHLAFAQGDNVVGHIFNFAELLGA